MTHSKEYITEWQLEGMKVHQKFKKNIESTCKRFFDRVQLQFQFSWFFSNIQEFVEWKDVWSPFLAGLAFSIG